MNGLLTPKQVAEKLQVKEKTVREMMKQKRLKGIKIGRLWRIKESDLQAFLNGSEPRKKKPTR